MTIAAKVAQFELNYQSTNNVQNGLAFKIY